MKLHPVRLEETDKLKHGEVFTIAVDKTAKNWEMVDNKTFIAVPIDYSTNEDVRNYWDDRIKAVNG